jgi:hypothetical protein
MTWWVAAGIAAIILLAVPWGPVPERFFMIWGVVTRAVPMELPVSALQELVRTIFWGVYPTRGNRGAWGWSGKLEQGSQARQHALTCVGWRDATGGAIEQADSEALFELADGVAERARGQPELRGRLGEAAAVCDCHKGAQLGEARLSHCRSFDRPRIGSRQDRCLRPYARLHSAWDECRERSFWLHPGELLKSGSCHA